MTEVLTAEQIAELQGVNIHTVRRWFRTPATGLAGRKIGRNGWITTRTEYERWLAQQPDLTRYPLTAEQIAAETHVSLATVRGWFRDHELPGTKVRGPAERGASWRTTRADFDRWYAAFLTAPGSSDDSPLAVPTATAS